MAKFFRTRSTESRLLLVLIVICVFLSFASDSFFTLVNLPRC